ncbi:MAG: T9SS type A sorting domain-containing protein [Saprospiraceae bacterium]|nr:T9SS type A sorting domain-containing protein [Saprospiraceae bacterium]
MNGCRLGPGFTDISDFELKLAGGNVSYMTPGALWYSERLLLKKLTANPSFMSGNAVLQQFYNSKIGTNMGAFNQIEATLAGILLPNATTQASLDANYDQKAALLAQIAVLDEQVQVPQAYSPDFDLLYLNAKNNLMQGVQAIDLNEAALNGQIVQAKQAQLNSVLATNAAIAVNTVYEANQKDYNEVLIRAYLELPMTTVELDKIRQIAQQCESGGGPIVKLARALLPGCETENLPDESEGELCVREKAAEHDSHEHELVGTAQVYPNPTTESLNIQFNEAVEGSVKLINASGELVWSQKLEKETFVQFDTKDYPKGIYFLELPMGNGFRELRKVVLQ